MRGICLLWVVLLGLALPETALGRSFAEGRFEAVAINNPAPGELQGFCLRWSWASHLHIGGGVAALLGQGPPGTPGSTHAIYFIDVTTAFQCGWNRDGRPETAGFQILPQLGYSAQFDGKSTSHLGRFGIGLGFGNVWATSAYVPRMVIGASEGVLTLGLRHGITTYFVHGLLALELAHQMLYSGDRFQHDLRIVGHLNLAIVFYVLGGMR